jgi:hypothetical protein
MLAEPTTNTTLWKLPLPKSIIVLAICTFTKYDYNDYNQLDLLEVNAYESDSTSVESRVEIDDENFAFTKSYDGYDSTIDNYLNDGDEYQVSTAISKLQIKLNVTH